MSDPHPIQTLNDEGAPDFFEQRAERLLAEAIGHFEAATGRALAPSQVENYLLETIAYMLTIRAGESQSSVEQNLLAYAVGDRLDVIGADRATPRLQATFATVTARLAGPFTSNRAIPEGFRINFGGAVFAVRSETLAFNGAAFVDVELVSLGSGPVPTVLVIGDAGALVDTLPGVTSAVLSTLPVGGALREEDGPYRVRIALAPERISRGGSRLGYEAVTRDWDARVLAVYSVRTQPGYIRVVPLMLGSQPISDEDQASLLAYLGDGRTPQGDFVSVEPPVAETFAVALSLVVERASAVAEAEAAVGAVLDAWRATLGGRIVPSDLTNAARAVPGVIDASVDGLEFLQLPDDSFRDGQLQLPSTVEVVE